ncbi:hypothetical protein DFW12_19825 [Clostridioides difficile]|nr:hypothetical protein [Clostridioides difficile]
MIKNNYILKEKMLYKLLGYFTYTCCKFTYHIVNIKLLIVLCCLFALTRFTYLIVNIKQSLILNTLVFKVLFTYHLVNIKL